MNGMYMRAKFAEHYSLYLFKIFIKTPSPPRLN